MAAAVSRAVRQLALVLWIGSLPALALAQDAPDPDAWRALAARGRAALEAGRYEEARAAFSEADDALAESEGLDRLEYACDRALAELALGGSWSEVVGEALSASAPRRAQCFARLGAALSASRPDVAAIFLLRARAEGVDVEVPLAALQEPVRVEAAARLAALDGGPLARAIPPQETPEALARAIAESVQLARPSRSASCSREDEAWDARSFGVITCSYADAPLRVEFGNRYPRESFIWERARGRVRAVASFASGADYDCEYGHEEPVRAMRRLTAREHGVDGWLLTDLDRWSWSEDGDEEREQARRYAYACTRASGACVRVEAGMRDCVRAARGGERCTRAYDAEASVRDGRLSLRARQGELPEALREPVLLSTLEPPPPASAGATTSRLDMSGCRIEVHDERPPLNVRARPSTRAPVVGTLADGTVVTPARGRDGSWVELRAPLRGWVWTRNLRRVCAGRDGDVVDDAP